LSRLVEAYLLGGRRGMCLVGDSGESLRKLRLGLRPASFRCYGISMIADGNSGKQIRLCRINIEARHCYAIDTFEALLEPPNAR
jgi:hypothetical protein